MKRTKHLQQLMNYYLDNEIEHFKEMKRNSGITKWNVKDIDNHIIGTWFKLIEELPSGKEYVESTKLKIKNDLENPMVTYFDGKNHHYISEKEMDKFDNELSTLINKL